MHDETMMRNTLGWRQMFVGQIMPVLLPLLVAIVALLVAQVNLLAARVADNMRRITDNHAETIEAVRNGPANKLAAQAAKEMETNDATVSEGDQVSALSTIRDSQG